MSNANIKITFTFDSEHIGVMWIQKNNTGFILMYFLFVLQKILQQSFGSSGKVRQRRILPGQRK